MNDKPPPLSAVAISYQNQDKAPRVVAKGRGLIAEEIISRANEHGIFIHQSKELVSLLMKVDLDENIPPLLYQVVAELLAWIYHMETEAKNRNGTKEIKAITNNDTK
jgi:flagellar biosynthesis protein